MGNSELGEASMYIKPRPVGANPPLASDRQPIWRVTSGADLSFTTRVNLKQGAAVTSDNSRLTFKLAENRFHFSAIWTGEWSDGIEEVDRQNHPGLIQIRIPDSVGDKLRRGAYSFSLEVSDEFGKASVIPVVGTMLVEYEPTSPQHDIPYSNQEGEA
jgi:hypothetical protein